MRRHLILTAVGNNRQGIVADLTGIIFDSAEKAGGAALRVRLDDIENILKVEVSLTKP
jgi:glycine cleavage system regulatory protein